MGLRDILSCSWLGDELFGQDVDTLFAYQTPRVVKINDRALGLLKNLLTLGIFIYIFIFNIWFKGAHFSWSTIEGVSRLQWQEPTRKCNPFHKECKANFNSIKDLPYCNGYAGDKPAQVVRDCEFFDARELPIPVMDGVMIPTFIANYKQTRACPAQPKGTCDRKWAYSNEDGSLQSGTGYARPVSSTFVADAGAFTLLIDHNFKSNEKANVQYDDFKMQGYWEDCDFVDGIRKCVTKPITCVHTQCEELKHRRWRSSASLISKGRQSKLRPGAGSLAPEAPDSLDAEDQDDEDFSEAIDFSARGKLEEDGKPKVIAIADGDVLSLSTMLQMAGTSLEEVWKDEGELQSVRARGLALVISIEYKNLKRWTLFKPEDPPWYTIKVEKMKSHKFKHAHVTKETGQSRDMQTAYGVFIVVKQTGWVAYFDTVGALVALTSAMALLVAANTLTDFLMLYVLPHKDKYKVLKYKESEDFNPPKQEETAAGS